ncbi:hypothetical protein JHK82_027974 [Glycine max]|nr:hypothetical protein JHK87_027883 [Glycine soja]KAG4997197.1 hypothetical protein JHK85_028636 [Glycine max]KAG5003961.1 hypothetical protein JHK86_028100 [Glycine max]KAG5127139.1 hypothetical protein JHK82_027974 [Glycine max]KAG5151757.1 hypothetical protein JHK84_028229 [Glycine max]
MEDRNEEYGEDEHEESTLLSILQDDIQEAEDASAIINEYAMTYLCKEPCRISKHTRNL